VLYLFPRTGAHPRLTRKTLETFGAGAERGNRFFYLDLL
jgi:hypothetical protein